MFGLFKNKKIRKKGKMIGMSSTGAQGFVRDEDDNEYFFFLSDMASDGYSHFIRPHHVGVDLTFDVNEKEGRAYAVKMDLGNLEKRDGFIGNISDNVNLSLKVHTLNDKETGKEYLFSLRDVVKDPSSMLKIKNPMQPVNFWIDDNGNVVFVRIV